MQVLRTDQLGQPLPGPILAGSAELLPGDTTFSINVFLDPSGPNNFVLIAQDYATGAVSAASPAVTILPPPAAPTLANLEATRSGDTTQFEVSGTSQPNTRVQAFRAANGARVPRTSILGYDTLFGGQTNFSLRFSMEDLPRQLGFTAVDASGNESLPTIVPLISTTEREGRSETRRKRDRQ